MWTAWFSAAALIVLVGLGGWGASVDGKFHLLPTLILLAKQWIVFAVLAGVAHWARTSARRLARMTYRFLAPLWVGWAIVAYALTRVSVSEVVAVPYRIALASAVILLVARAVHSHRVVSTAPECALDPFV